MVNTQNIHENEAEKRFFEGRILEAPESQKTDSVRENIKNTLDVMGLESEGVHVEDDGTVALDRSFMVNALKEKGVEVMNNMTPSQVAVLFINILGDEFQFLSGAKEIKAKQLPSLAELESKPAQLPEIKKVA